MILDIDIFRIGENPHLFLNKGEKICKPCKGWGFKIHKKIQDGISHEYLSKKRCPRCLGRCSLEFIDAVVGQNRDARWL